MTTTIIPKCSTEYEVGAILVDHWGYEQTNVDYYCIIKMAGDWITVAPMTKTSEHHGSAWSMDTVEMPTKIEISKPVFRKKLKRFDGVISGFSMRDSSGGWCRLWNGKPQIASHYA